VGASLFQRSVLPVEEWEERLALEYSLVLRHEPTFDVVDGNLQRYEGVIIGGDTYQGGFFKIAITIPREFPFKPPEAKFLTKIWHPNITSSKPAKICESILSKDWTPALHIFTIIEALRTLLAYPNPDDPLNNEAAAQMKKDRRKFRQKVEEFVRHHATPELAFR